MKQVTYFLGFLFISVSALAGNELGNGGDHYAQEFISLGRAIVSKQNADRDPLLPSASELSQVVEETQVTTKDSLLLREVEVDAINYPEQKKIEVSRARWQKYSAVEKAALVLHEYLGVANIEDSKYQISGSYSLAMGKTVEDVLWGQNGRRFSIGIGGGYQSFKGNIGLLYKNTFAQELKINYLLDNRFGLKLGFENSSMAFEAAPSGVVDNNLKKLELAGLIHFRGETQLGGRTGLDPYLFLGLDHIWRKQEFASINVSEKDTAFGWTGGLGVNMLVSQSLSFWVEGKYGEMLFKDRYSQMYAESGIPDMKGALLAGSLGMQALF